MYASCELLWFFLKASMKIKTQQTQFDKGFVLSLNASTERCLTHHPNFCKLNQGTKELKKYLSLKIPSGFILMSFITLPLVSDGASPKGLMAIQRKHLQKPHPQKYFI